MSAVELFSFNSHQLRIVVLGGRKWAVAADICAVLEISNVADAMSALDEDEKGVATTDTPGGDQRVSIINEPGLYSLILRSRKPEAKAFKRWVTHEVLPAIRETGRYEAAPVTPRQLAELVIAEADRADTAEAKVAELTPKAELADTYLIADKATRLVREAAKLLKMREVDLRRFLVDEELIFAKHAQCGDIMYDHYAQFAHHFVATETVVNHSWGTCSHYTLRITPRGIDLIRKRRARAGVASA